MNVLFVHEVSYRKKPIFEMHEFPEFLAVRGHDVHFLEFDEGRRFWRPDRVPRSAEISGRIEPEISIHVHRPLQIGIPGLDRILVLVTVLPTLLRLMQRYGYDAVVLYAVPTYGLQTIRIARRFSVPVLFRSIDVSHKIRRSFFSPVIKRIEKQLYKRADLLSAHNEPLLNYCVNLSHRTSPSEIHLPIVNLDRLKPIEWQRELAHTWGVRNSSRVIVYMGTFFHFAGLTEVLRRFSASKRDDVQLLLVGGGNDEKKILRLVKKLELDEKVIVRDFVPYSQIPAVLSLADVAISTLVPSIVSNFALSNKVLKYLACGVPTACTKLHGMFSVLESADHILWGESPSDVFEQALRITDSLPDRGEGPREALDTEILDQFSVLAAGSKFESGLHALVKSGGR